MGRDHYTMKTTLKSLQEEVDRLHRLAYTDDLTGLPNARAIREYARRDPGGYWVIADLNDFKAYQDAHGGHEVGDLVLRQFARFLRRNTRQRYRLGRLTDIVAARLHGDEFAVYVCGSEGRAGVKRIQTAIHAWNMHGVTVTAGVGRTEKYADHDLYKLKKAKAINTNAIQNTF